MHSYVHSSIISNSQDREMTSISIDSWINKKDVVHAYNGYYSVIKDEWNNAIFRNMDATRDYHTKWSKSEKGISYDTTYMWNLKYDTNEPTYKAETDSPT